MNTVTIALGILDQVIQFVKHVRAQSGLSDTDLSTQIDAQVLQNSDDIKKLLSL
jgi:hypothetical protein